MWVTIVFPDNPDKNYIITIDTEEAIPVLMKEHHCSRAVFDFDNREIILYQ